MPGKNKNALDLDALESEGRPEPLTFTYRGKEFVSVDPYLLSYEDFLEVDWSDNEEAMRKFLGEGYDGFMACKPTAEAVRKLVRGLDRYYQSDLSQGEADGSPTS